MKLIDECIHLWDMPHVFCYFSNLKRFSFASCFNLKHIWDSLLQNLIEPSSSNIRTHDCILMWGLVTKSAEFSF